MQAPSASNSVGTLLGTLAGAAVTSVAPSWPFLIAAAGAVGMSPLALAGIAAVGVTALVNYAVTHIAEVNNLNELAKDYWPQIQGVYPAAKDGAFPAAPVAVAPATENINKV